MKIHVSTFLPFPLSLLEMLVASSLAHAGGAITGLDDLPGTLPPNIGAAAFGLSDDGQVLVGAVRLDAFNYRAYRFDTSGKTQLPGTLGYQHVLAQATSADGSVIVGYELPTYASADANALVWTNGTMTILPDLNLAPTQFVSASSKAVAVSNDGSVVAGHSLTSAGRWHAVRWIGGAAPVDLDNGASTTSFTADLDDTGATVVGYRTNPFDPAGLIEEAFRWTAGGGMAGLGVLAGDAGAGARSRATGVSANGGAVAGWSRGPAPGDTQTAFRWTQANGMQGLGLLTGGTYSLASDINADGSVIVGNADRPVPGMSFNGAYAFRWQDGVGMQTVGDWLAANGVTVGSNTFTDAVAVDASGNVVVGKGQINGYTQTYIARVSGTTGGTGGTGGTGVIGLADFNATLAAWRYNLSLIAQRYGLTLWGAHHRPLMDTGLANDAGTGLWVTGDIARDDDSDARQALGEVGVFHDLGPSLRLGLGLGAGGVRLDSDFGGKTRASGGYAVFEADYAPGGKRDFIVSVTGLIGRMDATVRRGYLNGATLDASSGDTDADTVAVRLRVDKRDAIRLGRFGLNPYAAFSYARTELDAYAESGGGFPAAYAGQRVRTHELRLGATATTALTDTSDLRLSAELAGARNDGSAVTGAVLGAGGFAFAFGAADDTRTWGRLGVEIDHRIGKASVLSGSLHGASEGNDARVSASLGWKTVF